VAIFGSPAFPAQCTNRPTQSSKVLRESSRNLHICWS